VNLNEEKKAKKIQYTWPLVSVKRNSSPYLIGCESATRFGRWIIKAVRSVGRINVVPVAVTSFASSSAPERWGIPVAKQQLNWDFSPVCGAECVHVFARRICWPKWSKLSLALTLNGSWEEREKKWEKTIY